jgi:hypothetical protein
MVAAGAVSPVDTGTVGVTVGIAAWKWSTIFGWLVDSCSWNIKSTRDSLPCMSSSFAKNTLSGALATSYPAILGMANVTLDVPDRSARVDGHHMSYVPSSWYFEYPRQ